MEKTLLFRCKDLTVRVNEQVILNSVNLEIYQGEHVAFTGPSGSGKSSLLRTFLGFMEPTWGEVFFKDEILSLKNISKLRLHVATLFQEPKLSGETVKEAILFPFTFSFNKDIIPSNEMIIKSLENAGLTSDILDKSVDKISGGEKQRIAFIRTDLLKRKILFADEPTSALDKESRDTLSKLILSPERTALIVTHDEKLASLCDRVIEIDNGKLVSEVRNANN